MGRNPTHLNGYDLASDFITDFLNYTADLQSPKIYRLWSAICAIAGALERRIWTDNQNRPAYPNLYVLLVGAPGVGKTNSINLVENLWRSTKELHIAPHNTTKASLIDRLEDSKRIVLVKPDFPVDYTCLLVVVDELNVLIPAYDSAYLGTISRIWDNPDFHEEARRTGQKTETKIDKPTLNILTGVQPEFLGSIIPTEAWGQGAMARFIMIYSNEVINTDIWGAYRNPHTDPAFAALKEKFKPMLRLWGQCQWHPAAADTLSDWARDGCPPVPHHVRLEHWNRRRAQMVMKLSMISAVSRTMTTVVEPGDLARAFEWLMEVEAHIPSVFHAMATGPDRHILDELYYYLISEYNKTQMTIPKSRLVRFLQNRMAVDKIDKAIESLVESDRLTRIGGTNGFLPNVKAQP